MAKQRPTKPSDDLAEVNSLVVKLVRRELAYYDSSNERVPSALLSTATQLLKSYQVQDDARDQEVLEDAQVSAYTFRSRLAPEWVERVLGLGAPLVQEFSGITDMDIENVLRKAKYLLDTLPEDHVDRAGLEQVVAEAEKRKDDEQPGE
jgi:hypothetical protein